MPTVCGTHGGGFHADDVLAFALVRAFVDEEAELVRTRDLDRLATCDIVFDVGGEFDPERCRFDHHQADYTGSRSSAGMVLDWLEAQGKVDQGVATVYRRELVDYVDDVDNGRRTPDGDVPCFSSIVGMMQSREADPDQRFMEAARMATFVVRGIQESVLSVRRAESAVHAAMDEAVAAGRRTLFLEEDLPWKRVYFDNGGVDHPTDFVLLPSENAWRVICVPPEPGSFANKVPLPEEWAGLTDDELSEVVGVVGARFCHKNRFIAVFATRDGALEAMRKWNLGGL